MAACIRRYTCNFVLEIKRSYQEYYDALEKHNRFSDPLTSKDLVRKHKEFYLGKREDISNMLELIAYSPCVDRCEKPLRLLREALKLEPLSDTRALQEYLNLLRRVIVEASRSFVKVPPPRSSEEALQALQLLNAYLREEEWDPCVSITCYTLVFTSVYLYSKILLEPLSQLSSSVESVNALFERLYKFCDLLELV